MKTAQIQKTMLGVLVDKKIFEQYRKFCKENGLVGSRFVEKAILAQLAQMGEKQVRV